MTRYLRSVLFIAPLILMGSCTSLSTQSPKVVERSNRIRPKWVVNDFSGEANGEVFLVHRKPKANLIELGIKQAEIEGITQTKKLAIERVALDLREKAQEILKKNATESRVNFIANGAEALLKNSSFAPSDAKPKQVYYERIEYTKQGRIKTYYDIFILLTIGEAEYLEGLNIALTGLRKAKDPLVRSFAAKYISTLKDKLGL